MYNNELYHYGVKGMRWGVRRYQNKDGSLTDKGKKHYDSDLSNSSDGNKSKKNSDNKLLKMTKREATDKLIENRSHVEEVTNQLKQDYSKLKRSAEGRNKYANMKESMRKVYQTFDPKDADNYEKAYKEWRDYTKKLGKTYVDKLNTARVKALGFDDVETGKKFLKDNFLDFDNRNFDVDYYLDRDKKWVYW